MNQQHTIDSIGDDLVRIKSILINLEKQMSPELYTVKTTEEANNLFSYLTTQVEQGNAIELIIRRV